MFLYDRDPRGHRADDNPAPMTPNPRQAELLEAVRTQGALRVEALAERFGVTLQTVRRDVKLLTAAGLLSRFHGGVRAPASTTENLAYLQRQAMNAEGKQRLARAAAAAVPDHCSLFINLGTTTECVARALLQHRGLRVITNHLNVAATLSANPDFEVIVTGGVVRGRDHGVVGEAAVAFVRQFRVDIGLIGISGIEEDGSLRDYDFREIQVARAIIESSREVWLCADASKFHRPAMVELARLDQVDRVFTDAPPPDPFPAMLADAGVDLVVAGPAREAGPAPAPSAPLAPRNAE